MRDRLLQVRLLGASDAELVLDAGPALHVGREALALLGEIARAVVAFRRGVVRQIENPARAVPAAPQEICQPG
jgi:hypothetical protein